MLKLEDLTGLDIGADDLFKLAQALGARKAQPVVTEYIVKYRAIKNEAAAELESVLARFRAAHRKVEDEAVSKLKELGFEIPPEAPKAPPAAPSAVPPAVAKPPSPLS